ncbi:MAG: SpoIIE family protein phosphatase [Arthrobacter sp.]
MDSSIPGPIEQARLAALRGLSLMDTPAEERFDRITRIARALFGMPNAEVNLLDDTRLFTKSPRLPGQADLPLKDTICGTAIQAPGMFVVPDAAADPRFADVPGVVRGDVRFYAGRPLSVDGGSRVGVLCVYDTETRAITPEQLGQLDELGRWAERELRASADRDRAYAVQQALLPAAPGASLYEIAGICLPKEEVGGDFYSWQEASGSLNLVLADAMGKGTSAALMAATVRATVRTTVRTADRSPSVNTPEAVLDLISAVLKEDLASTGTFATAFLARLDPVSGSVEYVDAGHGLTIIIARDGSYRRLHGYGLPIGIGEPGSWESQKASLEVGETLLTFTDGLLDLYDGTLAALDNIAALVRSKSPGEAVAVLQTLVRNGKQDDDVTAVIVARTDTSN